MKDRMLFWLEIVCFSALAGLCLALPLEFPIPGMSLGAGRELTSLKLHVILTLGLTGLLVVLRGDWGRLTRHRLFLPAIALSASFFLSCIFAPDHRANALKFALRWGATCGLLLTCQYLSANSHRRMILVGCLAGGVPIALLGCLAEMIRDPLLNDVPQLIGMQLYGIETPAGQFRRLRGTFAHPNELAGYFAILAPIIIAWVSGYVTKTGGARAKLVSGLAIPILLLLGVVEVLTVSRGGLVCFVIGLIALTLGGFALGAERRVRWICAGLTGVTTVGILVGVALSYPMQVRLGLATNILVYPSPTVEPQELAAQSGQQLRFRFTLQDSDESTVLVQGQWFLRFAPVSDSKEVVGSNKTQTRSQNIPASQLDTAHTVRMTKSSAGMVAGEVITDSPLVPGKYEVVWTIIVHPRHWFRPQRKATITSSIVIGDLADDLKQVTDRHLVEDRPNHEVHELTRYVLWSSALKLFRRAPLTGVGGDNFRLMYEDVLDPGAWPPELAEFRSHNLYLEFLTNLGVIGFSAFIWFSISSFSCVKYTLAAEPDVSGRVVLLGLGIGLAIIYIHGTVDFFLGLTNMMSVFSLICGLVGFLDPPPGPKEACLPAPVRRTFSG